MSFSKKRKRNKNKNRSNNYNNKEKYNNNDINEEKLEGVHYGDEYNDGEDSYGNLYRTIEECWEDKLQSELMDNTSVNIDKDVFNPLYQRGKSYWADVDCTDNGMLGGFAHVSNIDIAASLQFLKELPNVNWNTVIDCGAGIGRITRHLLLPHFECVDLLEQDESFVNQARKEINDKRMREFYVCGLQNFVPKENEYDIIWIQWCLGHLPEPAFIDFLKRCRKGLKPNGYICIKENIAVKGFLFDDDDASVTRDDRLFKQVFKDAQLNIIRQALQPNFPKKLFPVKMYALQ